MAARLTDKQKKKIVADYLELGSYRATAKKNDVADGTVKRIVLECGDFEQKIPQISWHTWKRRRTVFAKSLILA